MQHLPNKDHIFEMELKHIAQKRSKIIKDTEALRQEVILAQFLNPSERLEFVVLQILENARHEALHGAERLTLLIRDAVDDPYELGQMIRPSSSEIMENIDFIRNNYPESHAKVAEAARQLEDEVIELSNSVFDLAARTNRPDYSVRAATALTRTAMAIAETEQFLRDGKDLNEADVA